MTKVSRREDYRVKESNTKGGTIVNMLQPTKARTPAIPVHKPQEVNPMMAANITSLHEGR